MNLFEDLIDELKNENLLEDTVIEVKKPSGNGTEVVLDELNQFGDLEPHPQLEAERSGQFDEPLVTKPRAIPEPIKTSNDREFFRKRAMEEVSSLQMVEHVLAGVEREHLKLPAAAYDDLEVKKTLHRFLQVPEDVNSDQHAEAEFALMQETQQWHSALSARDRNVSVANIRRFCENSRPVLSSQALMALARFYRNSSFSEEVRGKFDFVMTRLFSRDAGLEKRKLLFQRAEMASHIKTLYQNWSSISYHATNDHQADIELAVQRFDDLISHFETAQSFDDLLNADVFGSIRQYKETCGELFYVPEIAAAAIDCNVRLGNRYVDLIFKERSEHGAQALEAKYGYTYDLAASNAANKTLLLFELLRERPEEKDTVSVERPAFEQESFHRPSSQIVVKDERSKTASRTFGVNRWLVAATILVTLASTGLYFWADKYASDNAAVSVANSIDLEGTDLKTYLNTLRASHETGYAVTQPSWDALSENDQKEFLKKVFVFAQTKGLKKVNLLNYKGKTVAFASQDRFELFRPN